MDRLLTDKSVRQTDMNGLKKSIRSASIRAIRQGVTKALRIIYLNSHRKAIYFLQELGQTIKVQVEEKILHSLYALPINLCLNHTRS